MRSLLSLVLPFSKLSAFYLFNYYYYYLHSIAYYGKRRYDKFETHSGHFL